MTAEVCEELRAYLEPVVARILRNRNRQDQIDDAIQDAWAIVLKMYERYDPSLGVPLTAYLHPYIRWTAVRAARSNRGGFILGDRFWRKVLRGEATLPKHIDVDFTNTDDEILGADQFPEFSAEGEGTARIELEQLLARADIPDPMWRRAWAQAEGHKPLAIAKREGGVSRQAIHQAYGNAVKKLREAV